MENISGRSSDDSVPAVSGTHSGKGNGVIGTSAGWQGVLGTSVDQAGVVGVSDKFIGVWGESHGEGYSGVYGVSDKWAGVVGASKSATQPGVWGQGSQWQGVLGTSVDQAGVVGVSDKFIGVWAEAKAPGQAALFAVSRAPGGLAGRFEGNVEVTGDVRLPNADCAEDFDVADEGIEPGSVLVISNDGRLRVSDEAYDHRVAGVVSGAGDYRPALVLDDRGRSARRRPVALLGKVFCKVDATVSPIKVGSLLTTSATPGHAMRATDRDRLAGAVLGKALRPLRAGRGLIPVLIALQ